MTEVWARPNDNINHRIKRDILGGLVEMPPGDNGMFPFMAVCGKVRHAHKLTRNEYDAGEFPTIGDVCPECEGREAT